MQMGTMVRNPNKYRLAGDPFGPEDKYGIGLPKDSDGVQFVNDFLQKIEDDGTWAQPLEDLHWRPRRHRRRPQPARARSVRVRT